MNDKVIMAAKNIINRINDKYGDNYRHVVDGVLIRMGYIYLDEDTSYARKEIDKVINHLSMLPNDRNIRIFEDPKWDYIARGKPAPYDPERLSWAIHSAVTMKYMDYELKRSKEIISSIYDLICIAWREWTDDLYDFTVLELKRTAEIIELENEG